MKKKLTKLEAIRGFASIYVVLHHLFDDKLVIFGKNLSFLFKFGQEAVILFFVLSGFVIYYAYTTGKDKSFKTFFSKRFLRIYIPLILVFLTDTLLHIQYGYVFKTYDFYTLGGNLLMLQDIVSLKPNVICPPYLGNSPLWSLSYEWWFYLIFFFLFRRFKENASIIAYITGTVAAATYIFYPNFVNRELMYLVIWWAGADIAKLYIEGKSMTLLNLKTPLLFLLACTLLMGINFKVNNVNATFGISPYLELRHFAFSLVAIIFAFTWYRLKWIGFKYTLGIFEFIASISFGIYISHWFLIVDAHYLDNVISNDVLRVCMYVAVCVAFAYIVERIIYVKLNRFVVSKLLKKA